MTGAPPRPVTAGDVVTGVNKPRRIKTHGRGWWGTLYQKEAMRLARLPDGGSTDVRLLLAALGRANNSGHACFDIGELARVLGTVTPQTGEIRALHRTSVKNAIDRGVAGGYLAPSSGPRCLLLQRELWERNRGGTPECGIHKTRAPHYRTSGWGGEPEPDPGPDDASHASSACVARTAGNRRTPG